MKQEVGDDLSVCVLNLEFVELKKLLYQKHFLVMPRCSKSFRELRWALSNSRSQTYTQEAAIEIFLENSHTVYHRQTILPNMVLLRSS